MKSIKDPFIAVCLPAAAISAVCFYFINAESEHYFVNIFLAIISLCAAATATGSFFHHMSFHSIAQKAFQVFTLLTFYYGLLGFIVFYGGFPKYPDLPIPALIERIIATGRVHNRVGTFTGTALNYHLIFVVVATVACYLDENKMAKFLPFCWAIIFGMALMCFFIFSS